MANMLPYCNGKTRRAGVNTGQEERKDLPLPEEKLQQYTPLVPGKVLYICRWADPLHPHDSCIVVLHPCHLCSLSYGQQVVLMYLGRCGGATVLLFPRKLGWLPT